MVPVFWLLAFLVICAAFGGVSFYTGRRPVPSWTLVIWPAISLLLGWFVLVRPSSSDNDMHDFGYVIGGLVGLVCVVAWLAGRVIHVRRQDRPT